MVKTLSNQIVLGLLLTIVFFPVSGQVVIDRNNSGSSRQISKLTQKIDIIRSESINQRRIITQKSFSSYDDAVAYLEKYTADLKHISESLEETKNEYYKIETRNISPSEKQKLKHQLEDIIEYTDNLISDLEIWNPSIENQPLKPKSPRQITEESKEKDPCSPGDCGSCDVDCSNPQNQTICGMEEAICKSKLSYCIAMQILKLTACRQSNQSQNIVN